MMHYSAQLRDQIFVKDYEFLSFNKNMGKNIGKYIYIKTWVVNAANNVLIMLNNLQQMHIKLYQKRVIQKIVEPTGDLIVNKIAKRVKKVSKVHYRIIQKQLQMTLMKKYLKKHIYSRRKTENSWWSKIIAQ